jgi:hypothetical protein
MAPSKRRVDSSSKAIVAPTSQPHTDMQASTPKDSEIFNLDDVSGDESDRGDDTVDTPTILEEEIHINDPDVPESRSNAANDIRYFFDKSDGKKAVCRECR